MDLLSTPSRWMTLHSRTPEGLPAVVVVDEAVALAAPYDGFDQQVVLAVELAQPDEGGQPGLEEKAVLRGFAQTLVDALGSQGRLVATVTLHGVREHLVYATGTSWMDSWQTEVPEGLRTHSFGVQVGEDAHWHGLRQCAGLEAPPAG